MAASNTTIILTAEPKGQHLEGICSGTIYPGTCVEIKRSVAESGGRWTWEAAGVTAASGATLGMAADGNRIPIVVVKEDAYQGRTVDTPYLDGDRIFLYAPYMGEELNVLLENQSGTADDFVVGSKLIVDDGTGKLLISASTPESEPFICLEAVTDMTADTLVRAMYTGY